MWIMMEIKNKLLKQVPISPLITFRICFGAIMLFSILRFWLNGWIKTQYISPKFYFTYMGFDWVKPLGDTGMYALFFIMGITSLLVLTGLWYRFAIILFFISFTYVELIDVTNYLNHYYLISLISFLMIFLPANRAFSLDVWINPKKRCMQVPMWTIGIIRLQIGMVYFFAGLAKLHTDWMLHALPMKIWLPAKSHLPVVGQFLYKEWVAYFFSWFGALYDLLIVFFLINRITRPYAYIAVIGFHICTAIVFPAIGMFPYVMILCSLIFLSDDFHQHLFSFFKSPASFKRSAVNRPNQNFQYSRSALKFLSAMLGLYFILQVVIPMRYLIYPGPVFWYEEGYRFSWRVMLMEKSGNTFFYIKEPRSGRMFEVNNPDFLTPQQEKMMSTQPDMIIHYARYLKNIYQQRGLQNPAVYAEGYVALNGERSRSFINKTVDLSAQELSWDHVKFILPNTNTQH